jgi:hypothetical protein
VHNSFAASHDDAMGFSNADFPEPVGPSPTPAFSELREPASDPMMEEPGMAEPSPMAFSHSADVISLDTMRTAMVANMVSNFEQDDLDVPAFLRKRGEVM